MHKDYVHEIPNFMKMAPLNIEVVNSLITFEHLFTTNKSKIKSDRASLDRRHLAEFDFLSKLVEIMTTTVSKEEGKKKVFISMSRVINDSYEHKNHKGV